MMKIGVLGTGRAGSMHAEILSTRVSELVLADPHEGRLSACIDKISGNDVAHITTQTPEELLKNSSIDGLAIISPTDIHAQQILDALRLEIPIFVEKPVSTSLESTLRVRDAVEETGGKVQVGFQRRFDTAYTRAKELMITGEIGQLRRATIGTMDQAPPAREFLAASGGIYIDCLIHDFDILRWVTGKEVKEVFAFGTDLGLADFADFSDVCETIVNLRMSDDVLVAAHSSRFNGQGYDVRMELHGTKHSYAVGFDEKLPMISLEPGVTYPHSAPWVDFIARFASCYQREIDAFLDVVQGRGNISATVSDAVESIRIAVAAGLSQRERRPVTLDEIPGA